MLRISLNSPASCEAALSKQVEHTEKHCTLFYSSMNEVAEKAEIHDVGLNISFGSKKILCGDIEQNEVDWCSMSFR